MNIIKVSDDYEKIAKSMFQIVTIIDHNVKICDGCANISNRHYKCIYCTNVFCMNCTDSRLVICEDCYIFQSKTSSKNISKMKM